MDKASRIRRAFGYGYLDQVRIDALNALEQADIPSIVIGGYAVQEYGHHRNTTDVDIVVPNRAKAREALIFSGKFKPNQGSQQTVTHRETKLEVDIMTGGTIVSPKGEVPLPKPTVVEGELVSLQKLVELKLDSFRTDQILRSHDRSDVVALVQINKLPRDYLPADSVMHDEYVHLWDEIQKALKNRLLS